MEPTLKQLEEMFNLEQQLDIPHRDRWYNSDFDKRESKKEDPQNKEDNKN